MTAYQPDEPNGEKRTEQIAAQMLASSTAPVAEDLLATAYGFEESDDVDELVTAIAEARRDLGALLLLADRLSE